MRPPKCVAAACVFATVLAIAATLRADEPHAEQVRARPTLAQAVTDGVAYLVKNQNPDGSWGIATETRGTEIYSLVPGSHDAFRIGTTALCVMALREAGEKPAHDRGVEHLIRYGQARRDQGDLMYNIWAHTYAIQALSIELQHKKDELRIRAAVEWHLDRLKRYETYIGGWNYYDFDAKTQQPSMGPTSFGTAAALVALKDARSAGVDVPEKMIQRAVRRLEEMRLPGGPYLYSSDLKYHPRHPANKIRGSIGRTQSCNFALWMWKSPKIGAEQLNADLENFFKEHNFIAMGRKRIWPHESWYATAPYYYYFGHYYTGRLLEKLGDEGKSKYGERLAAQVMPFQEPDGSWWDYAMWGYHKPYGTAFAIMTLMRCR
jgi:hypothetical protein